jgi:hypothetical protein
MVTTEQVESVKTFLWLLPMVVISEVLAGGLFIADFLRQKVYNVITLNSLQMSYEEIP